jgi:hypothetical protein
VSDMVALLEQWELANFKPEYQFVIRQCHRQGTRGSASCGRGGEVDTVFGFEIEAAALQWITDKSQDGC